jgi:hypothetical protein
MTPHDPFRSENEPPNWSGFYDMFVGLVAAGFTEDQALTLIAKIISHAPRPQGIPDE